MPLARKFKTADGSVGSVAACTPADFCADAREMARRPEQMTECTAELKLFKEILTAFDLHH